MRWMAHMQGLFTASCLHRQLLSKGTVIFTVINTVISVGVHIIRVQRVQAAHMDLLRWPTESCLVQKWLLCELCFIYRYTVHNRKWTLFCLQNFGKISLMWLQHTDMEHYKAILNALHWQTLCVVIVLNSQLISKEFGACMLFFLLNAL